MIKTTATRVEKHKIKKKDKYFELINGFCFKAKNLYNHANYIVRNTFIKERKWVRYQELDRLLKNDTEYPDYKEMPGAATAQQTLRMLDSNWSAFFKAIKKWGKDKTKFLGRPKLPKYKDKSKGTVFALTYQQAKLKDGIIKFPKIFDGFTLKAYKAEKLCQVRFLPHRNEIIVEVVYEVDIPDKRDDTGRYFGIDIGVDNLAAVVNNFGDTPFLINGKGLKSINQYFNKKKAYYQGIAKKVNGRNYTNRLDILQRKRDNKINDYMHKASSYIVEDAYACGVSKIVVGKNTNWKQEASLGKANNQNFVQIPMARFIEMIRYKAENCGISVETVDESYTSGTSFLDREKPSREFYNKSRRVHRGLFVSNDNVRLNADINGAFQILRKAVPNAFADGIEGMALYPVKVNC